MKLEYTEVSQIPKSVIVEYIIGSTDRSKGWVIALGEQILKDYHIHSPINREKMRKRVSALWNGEFLNTPETIKPVENMLPKLEGEKKGFNSLNLHSWNQDDYRLPHTTSSTYAIPPDMLKYGGNIKVGTGADYDIDKAKNTWVNQIKKPILYLVIGDLHEPYSHSGYLAHCISVSNKWAKIANSQFGEGKWDLKVIFIGDELDNHSLSYHEHNPNLSSPMDELTQAKFLLKKWYDAFDFVDDITVIEGNHSLVKRKAVTAGIPSPYLKDIAEVLGVPKWKFRKSHICSQYNIHFHHGTKVSAGASINYKAVNEQMSQVVGHHHTKCQIEMANQQFFTMFVGCGINEHSPAFNYADGFAKRPVLSCGVIYDGQPILEPMKQV